MRKKVAGFAMTALMASLSLGQHFEVASVRQALQPPPQGTPRGISGGPGTPDPTRATFTYVALHDLLGWAYGLEYDRISGPSFLTTEHYNIVAKVPEGATREQFNVMLRNLLLDRFKMTVHFEKRDFTAYEMTVAKGGLKMKEFVIDPKAPPPAFEADGRPARYPLTFKDGFPVLAPGNAPAGWEIDVNGRALVTQRQQGIASLALRLQYVLGPGVRIVDKTGLTGKYDYRLQYARPNNNAAAAVQDLPPGADFLDSIGEPTPDLVTALQQQLGLMLTKGKIAVDVLVIDHADRVPTEN